MNRALFLDRDGIFNEVIHRDGILTSPRSWGEVELFEGLELGLKRVQAMGFRLILASNQPCVETGEVSREFLKSYHGVLRERYQLDAMYYCPHADPAHPLRKPNPGMFHQGAEEFGLSLPYCFHLGDTMKDVQGALNGGLTPILWDRPYNQDVSVPFRVKSMTEVVKVLEGAAVEQLA